MSYPNPVAAIKAYLDGRAAAADDPMKVAGGVPKPRPTRLVRLMLAGATDLSVTHRDARVVVEGWEQTEYDAEQLGDLLHEWLCEMDTADGHVPQGRDGWLGGPYSQPDPDSGTPRSVQTVILRQRRQQ